MARWAIFGTGFISNTVAEAVKKAEGATLLAVAGRSSERVEAFAADHGIVRRYTSYDDALSDGDIDVVYVGLPNHAHLPAVADAARAGKAVLSEKSLTTTYADAQALIDSVTTHNVFFVEGLMYLSHPLYAALVPLLSDPRLGTIRAISGAYAADIKDVVNAEGGGTLYNIGCYPASLLQLIMQSAFGPDAFAKRTLTARGNANADGNICDAAVTVHFGNGVLATLHSTDSYGMHHHFDIVGDAGTLRFVTNPWLPRGGDNVLEIAAHGQPPERIVIPAPQDAFYYQARLVEDCLAKGLTEAPRPSPRWSDSLEVMHFLTEWEAAARADMGNDR